MSNSIVFDDNTNINFEDINLNDDKIIIYSHRQGRKKNTYIIDWNISKDELKNHLKNLKRKHGCNGSIKIINFQGDDKEALHLQGEWKKEVEQYLLSVDIDKNNIEIKI